MRSVLASIGSALLLSNLAWIGSVSVAHASATDNVPEGPGGGTLVINAQNLEQYLFPANTDIAEEMNKVITAKDDIEVARGNLIPSLSTDLDIAFSAPYFMGASVSCLVPFLFPANWYGFYAAKDGYSAEVQGYFTTKLNTFAVAYTLAAQFQSDEQIVETLQSERKRVADYVNELQQKEKLGITSQDDVLKGQVDLGARDADLLTFQQLADTERAAVRKLLGLDLGVNFDIQLATPSGVSFVGKDPTQSQSEALERAPERMQLDLLYDQAQNQVDASKWGFLQGCGNSVGGSSSVLAGSGSQVGLNFGWGYFPEIDIAKNNANLILIRQQELKLEVGRLVESSLSRLSEAGQQAAVDQKTVQDAETLLGQQIALFEIGKSSVRDILETYNEITAAQVNFQLAQSGEIGDAVTLQRLALDSPFLQILIDSWREVEARN